MSTTCRHFDDRSLAVARFEKAVTSLFPGLPDFDQTFVDLTN